MEEEEALTEREKEEFRGEARRRERRRAEQLLRKMRLLGGRALERGEGEGEEVAAAMGARGVGLPSPSPSPSPRTRPIFAAICFRPHNATATANLPSLPIHHFISTRFHQHPHHTRFRSKIQMDLLYLIGQATHHIFFIKKNLFTNY